MGSMVSLAALTIHIMHMELLGYMRACAFTFVDILKGLTELKEFMISN